VHGTVMVVQIGDGMSQRAVREVKQPLGSA
jgi:hypothetical protein